MGELRKSIPKNMYLILAQLLSDTTKATEVIVEDSGSEYISPNETAMILQASRPYVMKLIKEKVLHTHKVGTHNKIKLSDVLALKQSWEPERKANMGMLNEGLNDLLSEEGWE